MKFLISLSIVLFNLTVQAFPYAQCQVELLKSATEALNNEFKSKAEGVDYFGEVTINFNEPLRPKAVFFGRGKPNSNKYCLVQVYMEKQNPSTDSAVCPIYKVEEIESNCQ